MNLETKIFHLGMTSDTSSLRPYWPRRAVTSGGAKRGRSGGKERRSGQGGRDSERTAVRETITTRVHDRLVDADIISNFSAILEQDGLASTAWREKSG